MPSTLDSITVLDLTNGAAGAIATMFLADHGARVVRIVAPGAPALRDGGFLVWDRGKSALALDVAAAARGEGPARGDFERLAGSADVVIDDFAPASPVKALLAPEAIEGLNPRLVACSITAYGKHGPLKDEPPIDDLVMARAGVLGGMPGFRPPPVHVVHPLPSVGAGLLAAIGIAAALLQREATGRGRRVATSLLAGALLYHPKVVGERIARHVFQTHPAGSAPFYSLYRCADGRYVQLGCVHEAFIATAAKLMGLTELIKEPRMVNGRAPRTPEDDAELRQRIGEIMAGRPAAAWAEAFEAADVPFAEARATEESLDDPQVLHNGMVVTLDDPAVGPIAQMGVPVQLSATPGRVLGPRNPALASPGECLTGRPAPSSRRGAPAAAGPLPPPLAGIRVLEITNLIAGPTTGRILADLGADVIKLEPPEGDMSRPIGRTYFYSVNFNKRSIAVDTRKPAGKEVVKRIAAKADALIANLRPGATARMGITPDVNPRLIEMHITGYGFTGPYSHRPGIDPLAQALMGLSRAQGGHENPPVFPAQLAPTDYTTGAMGAFGVILALYRRARDGTVQRVESNLLNGGILLTSPWFTRYRGRRERPLADREQLGLSPYHRLYRLRDGWIYVAADSTRAEAALCRLAGIDWQPLAAASAGARHPNDTAFARALAASLEPRGVGETLARLKEAGVPAAPALPGDSEIFLDDPHSRANGMVAERLHPAVGRMRVAWNSIALEDGPSSLGRPTPLLGEQSAEILSELGYDPARIAELEAEGTILIERPTGRLP